MSSPHDTRYRSIQARIAALESQQQPVVVEKHYHATPAEAAAAMSRPRAAESAGVKIHRHIVRSAQHERHEPV